MIFTADCWRTPEYHLGDLCCCLLQMPSGRAASTSDATVVEHSVSSASCRLVTGQHQHCCQALPLVTDGTKVKQATGQAPQSSIGYRVTTLVATSQMAVWRDHFRPALPALLLRYPSTAKRASNDRCFLQAQQQSKVLQSQAPAARLGTHTLLANDYMCCWPCKTTWPSSHKALYRTMLVAAAIAFCTARVQLEVHSMCDLH